MSWYLNWGFAITAGTLTMVLVYGILTAISKAYWFVVGKIIN